MLEDDIPAVHQLRAGALEASIAAHGATLTAIRYPDRHGRQDNILLGFEDPGDLVRFSADPAWCYPGSTVGRFANRIRDAAFVIDGQRHQLAANEGRHQRHGGPIGFDRRRWTAQTIEGAKGLRLGLESPEGDQGFPGAVSVELEATLREPATLAFRYAARTDAPTHINLTSHGYFNLDGMDANTTIEDHHLEIDADQFLPIDGDALPTGEIASVTGTPFDLRQGRRVGEVLDEPHPQLAIADGYNHCFVLRKDHGSFGRAARLGSPASGRWMEVWTTEPGLQFYSGNALAAAAGGRFRRRQALCLETQHFPDSPNQPHFPSTLLRPGDVFRSVTELRFGTEA